MFTSGINFELCTKVISENYTITILTILSLILMATFTKKDNKPKFTDKMIEQRLKEFQPKPLIDNDMLKNSGDENIEKMQPDEINSCLNLVKVDYYKFLDNNKIKERAEKAIRKYGIGSCGPRGFYGSIDIHLTLEKQLAEFMGMEEAVLYSYGFSTISSAIGAYCKKADVIFCDEHISFSARQGMLSSKARQIYYKHNDIKDLEKKMEEIREEEKKGESGFHLNRSLIKKFLIIEGIYAATGQICPLPEMIKLCQKYKVRIFIDETISFGTMGPTGRGITEHYGIDVNEIDMIMGSLEASLASIGGFCVGRSVIIEHQRLSGLGYCFSASLPPFLCETSLAALEMLNQDPELISSLKNVCISVDAALHEIDGITVLSSSISPLKVFTLAEESSPEQTYEKIERIENFCKSKNMYICQKGIFLHLNVNVSLTDDDITSMKSILNEAMLTVRN